MSRLASAKLLDLLPRASLTSAPTIGRRYAPPSLRRCRKYLVCMLPIIAIATTAYLGYKHPKESPTINRTRPAFIKPPFIDRSRMERLGMYDEPELLDFEWMGPNTFQSLKSPPSHGDVLLVTRLPDSQQAKHNNKFASNSIVDQKLCSFRDHPCRVLIAGSIGEQESKAQAHLQQIAILARSLNLTLVLPNMHKARFGACSRNKFEDYYNVESLKQLGVQVVTHNSFLEWAATRRTPPKAYVVEIASVGKGRLSEAPELELEPPSAGPSWRRCLSKNSPRLDFLKKKLHLAQNSTRLADLRAFGEQIVRTLNSSSAWDRPQVYALEWNLRHQIFEGIASRYLSYSKSIVNYATSLLDASGPTLVVQWRMESVPPENIFACSLGLVNLLQSILSQGDNADVKSIYFATDYPLEGPGAKRSGTFREIGEQHHAAVAEFRSAFQPTGPLQPYKLISYPGLSRLVPHSEGLLESDSGFLGIVDKLVAQKAELFVSGSTAECGRNSSFTKQIISARRDSWEHSRVRNEVMFFGRAG